ncbi:MAG TPA: NAD-dependent epimerase/dehydratase family protein [Gammaproteobacteria bacterium]|nr:NAD-dependent epimerase/dehydratase family protein [Gammaproteobacteria bacterium]
MQKAPLAPAAHFWKNKSVFVTGATGFLGGWLIRELLERDARVIALVRRERPDSQFQLERQHQRVTIVEGTVWDRGLLESCIEDHQIDIIFHTTMTGGDVTGTLGAPADCFRSTAESTLWMLEALRTTYSDTTLIVSSSDKAYGRQKIPYREEQPLAPRHPQEVAKAAQDLLAQSFGKVYGVKTAVTRCANYYGPFDFNFSRIVPYVARCAAEKSAPVLRSNGQFIRDFIHVQESAWAHLDLAERVAKDESVRGEAFNYSYGEGRTVLQIVNEILDIAGVRLTPEIQDTATHEIPDMLLSSEKARSMLGWSPRMTFQDSLETTVHWYLDRFGRA